MARFLVFVLVFVVIPGCPARESEPGQVSAVDPNAGTSQTSQQGVGGVPAQGEAGNGATPATPAPQAACSEPGTSCSSAACCLGSSCLPELFVCAADCTGNAGCQSGCCAEIGAGKSVCVPAAVCVQRTMPGSPGCGQLVLAGNDGQFLGVASSSPVAADGVCNNVSAYGSSVGADSIFNSVGTYGSSVSVLSAYSTITQTPPLLFCTGSMTVLTKVSKNTTILDAIDPDMLCATLAQTGL